MQLFGYKDSSSGFYFIQGNLISQYHSQTLKTIPFLIDTGSQITSISLKDALSIGIDFSRLSPGDEAKMINMTLPTKVLPNSALSFMLPDNQSLIVEMFNQITVHNPTINTIEDARRVSWIPSILGLDFLSRYKLVLQGAYMILEK